MFLAPTKWDEIDETAEFHSDAYAEMGIKESLPSNELVAGFLDWALDIFWKDKGGKPKKGSPEWKRKVREFAEFLKARQAEKKSDDSQSR